MLGARDRAEQQRPRFETAEMVPVALLRRVHGEQVQGARGDQPQHLRTLQVEAVESGAVDRRPHRAERAEDDVALVNRRHLIAP